MSKKNSKDNPKYKLYKMKTCKFVVAICTYNITGHNYTIKQTHAEC